MAKKPAAKPKGGAVAVAAAATPAPSGVTAGRAATLALVLGTFMAVAALPLCILFVVGLIPTFAAALIDRHHRRYLARAVAVMNLAGMVQPTMRLVDLGMSLPALQQLLGDPHVWLVMYGAASIGFLLNIVMPSIARVLVDVRADALQKQLEERAEFLAKEWGEELTGRKAEDK